MDTETALRALREVALATEHLRLLVLHGSRARGAAHAGSDWDLGYVAEGPLDVDGLRVAITTTLGTDAVDLVDLTRASALLRFRAASDGRPIAERPPSAWESFVLEATHFWCDAGSVIQRAQAQVLAELAP